MIRKSYAVWNNKGGVGKSTLTFHLAAAYAKKNKREKVLVVDMCPQANCTMMLLGSGTKGENRLVELETMTPAPTIAGYIDERINRAAGTAKTNTPASFWIMNVSSQNTAMPSNLWLIPGDGNLELLAAPMAYFANAQFPAGVWGAVHRWVRELLAEATSGDDKWTIFIDTNPSFSIYTELAMIAADELLIPFNADDSSRHAVSAIFRLLYGSGKANPVYDKFTFCSQTSANSLHAPKCHLFIGNRFTQHKGAAAAFSALSQAVADELWSVYQSAPQHFSSRAVSVTTEKKFRDHYAAEVRDFNTAGVVAAHQGVLISNLRGGDYDVHGKNVQVNTARVTDCADSIDAVVRLL